MATEPDSDDSEDACDDPEIVKPIVHYFYHLDYFQDGVQVQDVATPEELAAPPPKKMTRTSAASSRAKKVAPPQPSSPPTPKVHLIEHAKLFAMAVKYHVKSDIGSETASQTCLLHHQRMSCLRATAW
jgi:hypothetical protein